MRSGSSADVTLIFMLLKPGELIESVPYLCVLNTVKFPERSVAVRAVPPFASNSTAAFAIAAPFRSDTTPLIFVAGCWADACTMADITHINTNVKRCLLVHGRDDAVLFLTTEINTFVIEYQFEARMKQR